LEVELGITNISDFSYSVGSDEVVRAFSEYGQSCNDVGAPQFASTEAVYTVELVNGSVLPTFASFDSDTREFSVFSDDTSYIGTH